ncbi:MAG: YihY/virulence factor BrkB family protein [Ardenticatenales bacterium]|nr:YihY/virulence factor BrkB family protein [Ardenticatenales bacterium]
MAIREKPKAEGRWTRLQRRGWQQLSPYYSHWNQRSGGILSILADTWKEFYEDEGETRAAAIGYYTLFSLFPLTVLLALGMSYLVGESEARVQVLLIVARYLPFDLVVVDDIVQNVISNRRTLSLLAILAILWSGVQLFRVLEQAINRAWGTPLRRGFLRNIGFALATLPTMGFLTLISIGLTTLFEVARPLNLPFVHWAPLQNEWLWRIVSALPPFALTLALFSLMYRYMPHKISVRWRDVLPGALLATLFWEMAKSGFALYLSRYALQSYNLLYGSVGFLLALLTWVYVTGYIILFGAEFCAVLSRHRRSHENTLQSRWQLQPVAGTDADRAAQKLENGEGS